MGKRGRKKATGQRASRPDGDIFGQRASSPQSDLSDKQAGGSMQVPVSVYTNIDAGELELRGSLTPKARAEYAATLAGGLDRDDAWQRATELLFERLAVAWTISGVRTEKQKELLGRYRMAGETERRFVRDSLRAHVAEHFPEVQAP